MTNATARVAPEKADFRPALLPRPIAGLQPEEGMAKMTYAEQLKHPYWQKRRLERLEAAQWACENCGDDKLTLHVHHRIYVRGHMAWEYSDDELSVLCETCHEQHHITELALQELLLHYNLPEVVGLLGGFKHGDADIDPAFLEQCRQGDAYGYMLGFCAQLLMYSSMDKTFLLMKDVVVAEIKEGREIKMVFENSLDVFGRDR